jgi:hypothetical protein
LSVKREFKVNEHLILRLEQDTPERDITVIYIDDKELMACSFLLLLFYEEDILQFYEEDCYHEDDTYLRLRKGSCNREKFFK